MPTRGNRHDVDSTLSHIPQPVGLFNNQIMPGNDLRLLALDGGGVRGLSALMIIEQLMEKVNPDAPPKPCDYFDMIGGTSTGG
jgi:hypothetical protein